MEQKSLNDWLLTRLMSPSDLAKAANVDRSLISLLINGKRQSAKLSTIKKLASALEVDPLQVKEFAAIIEGKESRQPNLISPLAV